MNATDCRHIQDRLGAFIDGELVSAERLLVARHLADCAVCETEADALRSLGAELRASAPTVDSSALRGLAGGVISRVVAEQEHSWRTRLHAAFEDWHWLMIGTGSLLGTTACTLIVGSVLLFGPTPERADSLAARMNTDESAGTLFVVATPVGDDKTSMVMQFEGAGPEEAPGPTVVPSAIDVADEPALAGAIADVMTRGGRLVDLSALSHTERLRAEALLDDMRRLRVGDQRFNAGGSVTVHQLWLVAHASVSAKAL